MRSKNVYRFFFRFLSFIMKCIAHCEYLLGNFFEKKRKKNFCKILQKIRQITACHVLKVITEKDQSLTTDSKDKTRENIVGRLNLSQFSFFSNLTKSTPKIDHELSNEEPKFSVQRALQNLRPSGKEGIGQNNTSGLHSAYYVFWHLNSMNFR